MTFTITSKYTFDCDRLGIAVEHDNIADAVGAAEVVHDDLLSRNLIAGDERGVSVWDEDGIEVPLEWDGDRDGAGFVARVDAYKHDARTAAEIRERDEG